MKVYPECIPCLLKLSVAAARMVTDDEKVHFEILDSVMRKILQLPIAAIMPPELGQVICQAVTEVTRNNDPYSEMKRESNQLALNLYPQLKEIVANSSNSLLTATKLAIAGNTIDWGAPLTGGTADLRSVVEAALTLPLAIDHYDEFKRSIEGSSHILYIGDNAGEIVFDRILIEELRKIKDFDISFVIRGKPIANDVTLEDAVFVGLDEVANIIRSGSDMPSIILSQCSQQFRELYYAADTIVAKGGTNYEGLSEERGNIFFLFTIKCAVFVRHFNTEMGGLILKQHERAHCRISGLESHPRHFFEAALT